MDEITGPIIAITLVLAAVFLPSLLVPGLTGQFYRQFAVTIATAMIISPLQRSTLTPSRAVSIFKTEETAGGRNASMKRLPWWIFGVAGGVRHHLAGRRVLAGAVSTDLPQPDGPPLRVRFWAKIRGVPKHRRPDRLGGPRLSASLRIAFFGATEQNGLRCLYHGWKFDVKAAAWTFPMSRRAASFRNASKSRRIHAWEQNGIVWAYMGPDATIRRRYRNWAGRWWSRIAAGRALQPCVQPAAGHGR